MYVCIMYVYVCAYVCMYICMYVCMCYVCLCVCMYVYVYIIIYICKMKYLMIVHASCDITIKCCVERHIFFCLCLEKHSGVLSKPTSICRLFVRQSLFFLLRENLIKFRRV